MCKLIVLALFASVLVSCSGNPLSRVVGGEDAVPGQFPHQISLRFDHSHICGGSVISENYILTAAHCVVEKGVTPFPAEHYTIRSGTTNRIAGGVITAVKNVTVHQDYANFLNDVALLELAEPLPLVEGKIWPIELTIEEVPVESDIIISGWGLLETNGPNIPINLQYNTLTSISKMNCFTKIGFASDSLICLSHTKGNGACNGDSGGPATYNGKLAGVAGFVVTGCGSSRPDGYARVSYHIDWINKNMKL